MRFESIRFVPAGKTGTYTLALRGIYGAYSYVHSAVDDITVPGVVAEKLVYTLDGTTLTTPFTADVIDVYTPAGALVARVSHDSSIDLPGNGIYIVRATLGAKTLTARVAVK